jgi:hypothetical protein
MWFWRSWQAPLVDDFIVMPFGQVAAITADPIKTRKNLRDWKI